MRRSGFRFYKYHYGNIQKASYDKRRSGIWQKVGGKVYITCRGCTAINDINNHGVTPRGYIVETDSHSMGCVVCRSCGAHLFIRLLDWKAPACRRRRKQKGG